MKKKHMKV